MNRPLNNAELYCLAEKDEQYFRDWIGNNVQELAQRILGIRQWIKLRNAITVISRFGYFITPTLLSNLPTLGEEFCNAYTRNDDRLKRFVAILLNNELQLPSEIPKTYLNLIRDVHLITFYLFGDFYELSKRLTGLSYATNETVPTSSHNILNKLIGLASLSRLFIDLPRQLSQFQLSDLEQQQDEMPINATSSTNNQLIDQTSICQLCSSRRVDPTSTLCGHVFCWNCIHRWLKQNNECPICRMPNEPSRLVHLINFK